MLFGERGANRLMTAFKRFAGACDMDGGEPLLERRDSPCRAIVRARVQRTTDGAWRGGGQWGRRTNVNRSVRGERRGNGCR